MIDSAAKSVTWGNTAKKRFIKQHGSIDEIPEGDAHSIPKYESPVYVPQPAPEDVKAAEHLLSEKITALKNQTKNKV